MAIEQVELKEAIKRKIQCAVKAHLEASGRTQEEFADAAGISQPTVSQYINGNRMPGIVELMKVCSVIGVNLDDLLNGDGTDTKL